MKFERMCKKYNLHLLNSEKSSTFAGSYDIPYVAPYFGAAPEKLIPFHKSVRAIDKSGFVHFFLEDYQFERLWNTPERYLNILSSFEGILAPDFSLYADMPRAMQLWNTYRNRVLAHWLQKQGVPVIPVVSWSTHFSYGFCFDGLPQGGMFAVSTLGTQKNPSVRTAFEAGFKEFVNRCRPATVIVYAAQHSSFLDNFGVPVIYYPNEIIRNIRRYGR